MSIPALLVSLAPGCGSTHGGGDAGALADAAVAAPDAAVVVLPDAPAPTDDAGGRPHVDLILQLRDFDAFDGARATVRATDTSIGEVHGPVSATLVGGDADLVIERGFARDLFGEIGHLWIDVSADGACTDGTDVAYSFFINNDFGDGPETVEVRPADSMVTSITCAEATE